MFLLVIVEVVVVFFNVVNVLTEILDFLYNTLSKILCHKKVKITTHT